MSNPLALGRRARPTRAHRLALWEVLLGTVAAQSPTGDVRYFDSDWTAALAFAGITDETRSGLDLRTARVTREHPMDDRVLLPRVGQLALWARTPRTTSPALTPDPTPASRSGAEWGAAAADASGGPALCRALSARGGVHAALAGAVKSLCGVSVTTMDEPVIGAFDVSCQRCAHAVIRLLGLTSVSDPTNVLFVRTDGGRA